MGHGALPRPVMRTWTLEVRPSPDGMALICPHCGRLPASAGMVATQAVVVRHLAQHARSEPLPGHLRTCRCGEHGCQWHQRHRGCDGPIALLLTRSACGRIWRLADACRACAAATRHAAAVHEPQRATTDARLDGSGLGKSGGTLQVVDPETAAEDAPWWTDGALYG
ncbi:hypothetical protein SAMN05216252_1618 [Actinacidiphila glaucinigra]|uniref:Uncharacterized protein n=2 Tax=Actinacidiphila glaucinigra TaxID=235986 RepID=A0A239P0E7_9ACTN|nr:hypothetical protein SAMN05216252_1618 [Actinacidiphila glaucinigra]